MRLWDLKGNSLGVFQGHENEIASVMFSPDGQYIVSAGADIINEEEPENATVRLWDLKGNPIGEPFRAIQDGFVQFRSVTFTPDGQYILTTSSDVGTDMKYKGTVRFWRVGWKGWLQIACDRLQYHPVLKNPQTDVAKGAQQTCQKWVWSKENKK